MYWAQGIEQAPPVVQLCQEQVMRFHDPDEVVVLDEARLRGTPTSPAWSASGVAENPRSSPTCSASSRSCATEGSGSTRRAFPARGSSTTCLSSCERGFFAFRYHWARISSWILASEPSDPIAAMTGCPARVLEALPARNRRLRRAPPVRVAYYLDDEFREASRHAWRSSHPPSRFARRMAELYDPALYKRLLEG
jgi:hypothetical protein